MIHLPHCNFVTYKYVFINLYFIGSILFNAYIDFDRIISPKFIPVTPFLATQYFELVQTCKVSERYYVFLLVLVFS